nr:hypothetical protein [Kiloniella spongiae]
MGLYRSRKAHAERIFREFQWQLRDECLNEHQFSSYRHARGLFELD